MVVFEDFLVITGEAQRRADFGDGLRVDYSDTLYALIALLAVYVEADGSARTIDADANVLPEVIFHD